MKRHVLAQVVVSIFVLSVFFVHESCFAGTSHKVAGIEILGALRTNPEWLKTYIGYEFPAELEQADIDYIRDKLFTTQVFTDVLVEIADAGVGRAVLRITLKEKWTTVPVVRGAYGGGTPLRVFGVYDTHVFGSLWTLGAETRQYGSAPPGGVVWARAPRYWHGNHVQSYEYWREFRVRRIYDDDDAGIGAVRSDLTMMRVLLMAPYHETLGVRRSNGAWKFGADMRYQIEAPNRYDPDEGAASQDPPAGIHLSNNQVQRFILLGRTEFDDVNVEHLNYDGLRLVFAAGPLFTEHQTAARAEADTFFYWRFLREFNLCLHYFIGQTTSDSLESQYFLGGFDSIRGIPDGAVYGNRASYANTELRAMLARFKYAWLQGAVFQDTGGAGHTWNDVGDGVRASAGLGLRIAIPQVYRFVVRLDYAWSLDNPGVSGISLGMNQFFEPYKPL